MLEVNRTLNKDKICYKNVFKKPGGIKYRSMYSGRIVNSGLTVTKNVRFYFWTSIRAAKQNLPNNGVIIKCVLPKGTHVETPVVAGMLNFEEIVSPVFFTNLKQV